MTQIEWVSVNLVHVAQRQKPCCSLSCSMWGKPTGRACYFKTALIYCQGVNKVLQADVCLCGCVCACVCERERKKHTEWECVWICVCIPTILFACGFMCTCTQCKSVCVCVTHESSRLRPWKGKRGGWNYRPHSNSGPELSALSERKHSGGWKESLKKQKEQNNATHFCFTPRSDKDRHLTCTSVVSVKKRF